jgi:hypothetical protein
MGKVVGLYVTWQNVRHNKLVDHIYVRGTCVRDTQRNRLFSEPIPSPVSKVDPAFQWVGYHMCLVATIEPVKI